jgi:hypothetical protein
VAASALAEDWANAGVAATAARPPIIWRRENELDSLMLMDYS